MRLSLITINLNNASGLERTIKSIINQSFSDFEHIIIDGGSTDRSLEIIAQQKTNYTSIKGGLYWISEPDKGIYNAMNKGIKIANGDYCLFLNSGDWLVDNNTLAAVNLNFLDKDILYGNINYVDGDKVTLKKSSNLISIFEFLDGSLFHPSTFIKRELFERFGGYNENYKIVGDFEFFLRIYTCGLCSFEHLNQTITNYPINGISNNKEFKEIHIAERNHAMEQIAPNTIWRELKACHQLAIEYSSLKRFILVRFLIHLKKFKQKHQRH